MSVVEVTDLRVEYSSGDYVVRPLDGFRMRVDDGQLVLLLGPSGSGKTTLLSCLAGILTPTAGRLVVAGKDVAELPRADLARYRRESVGIVFQGFNLIPSLTARDNVAVPMRLSGRRPRDAGRRAAELLETVGLGERLTHRPAQMSGGQQQRVAIARALALDPPVLLADEPTAHLDQRSAPTAVRVLRRAADAGSAVLVATHHDEVHRAADRTLVLSGGRISVG
jgi:putative ABC transport system ATP-binding protein